MGKSGYQIVNIVNIVNNTIKTYKLSLLRSGTYGRQTTSGIKIYRKKESEISKPTKLNLHDEVID
jgi:hypothetical protein